MMNLEELTVELQKQMAETGLRFNVKSELEMEEVYDETANYIEWAYEQYPTTQEAVRNYLVDTMENYPEHIEPVREFIITNEDSVTL